MSGEKGIVSKLRKSASHAEKLNYAMFGKLWDIPSGKSGISLSIYWAGLFDGFSLSTKVSDERFSKCTRWKTKKAFKQEWKHSVNCLLDDLFLSIESGKASWLRNLADGIEAWHEWVEGGGPQKERNLLLNVYFRNGNQWMRPSIGELRKLFFELGYQKTIEKRIRGRFVVRLEKIKVCSFDDKDLRLMSRDVGLRLRGTKRGRPKKVGK